MLDKNKRESEALAFTWASVCVEFNLIHNYYFSRLFISHAHNWKKSGGGVALLLRNADFPRVIIVAAPPPPDLAQRFPVAALREESNVLIPYCMNVVFGIYSC